MTQQPSRLTHAIDTATARSTAPSTYTMAKKPLSKAWRVGPHERETEDRESDPTLDGT